MIIYATSKCCQCDNTIMDFGETFENYNQLKNGKLYEICYTVSYPKTLALKVKER